MPSLTFLCCLTSMLTCRPGTIRSSFFGPVFAKGVEEYMQASTEPQGMQAKTVTANAAQVVEGVPRQRSVASSRDGDPSPASGRDEAARTCAVEVSGRSVAPADAGATQQVAGVAGGCGGPGLKAAAPTSRRVEAIKRLSTPAFADPLRLPGLGSQHALRNLAPRQANHLQGVSLAAAAAPTGLITSVGCIQAANDKAGAALDEARAGGLGQMVKQTSAKRRLTHEINECLELLRQRDGIGGPSTPISSKSSRNLNPLHRLAADARAGVRGSPASRLGSPSMRMFTYKVSSPARKKRC